MQIAIFTIPLTDGQSETEKMNKLLRGNKIVAIDKQFFVNAGGIPSWTFCITYLPNVVEGQTDTESGGKHSQVDYKEVLTPEQFVKFDMLRQCRKEISNKLGMPVYAIFTNSELASMTTDIEELTEQDLLKIRGIGKGKVERFGRDILQLYEIMRNEKGERTDGANSEYRQSDDCIYQSNSGQNVPRGGDLLF